MNCYYHPEVPAVGVCKSCGRGICTACAAEVEHGIACRERCELRARIDHRTSYAQGRKLERQQMVIGFVLLVLVSLMISPDMMMVVAVAVGIATAASRASRMLKRPRRPSQVQGESAADTSVYR